MSIFAVAAMNVPQAYSLESSAHEKLYDFLSSVVGLDLTKYTMPQPSLMPSYDSEKSIDFDENIDNDFRYPPELGGLVEQQVLSPKLEYNDSKIDVLSIFYNGHMAFTKIYSHPQDDYFYSAARPTDILSQAKNLMQRYQTYTSQNYAKTASHLVALQEILNSVDDLSPTVITKENVDFRVSKDGDKTLIQWIFMQENVSMKWKRVSIEFRNNTFVSFRDTWALYNVSGLSKISSEQAAQIALDAAQKSEFRIVHGDGEREIIKAPDLSGAPYSVDFSMVPFRNQENTIPSKLHRDPLTLYPYWQVHFYFNETIAGYVGIQVGVWGDTSEIIYCSGFGYHGTSGTVNEALGDRTMNPSTLATVASLVSIPITIAISTIAVRRRNRHKQ
jgi:hypothetical protein